MSSAKTPSPSESHDDITALVPHQNTMKAVDIQVKLVYVIAFVALVILHEAGVVWWASSVSSEIASLKENVIDGDDVRQILDREAPWYHDRERIMVSIENHDKEMHVMEARMREMEKASAKISGQLTTILERLPP